MPPHEFSIMNLYDTGFIYINDWTSFVLTLGFENNEICFISIKG